MLVKEIMTKNVQTIEELATLSEAAKAMRSSNIGILPVLGAANMPVGVITDRDIALRAVAEGLPPNAQVREAMSKSLYSLQEDEDIGAALDLMKQKKIGRVLVTDRNGDVAGVVSLNDLAIVCNGDRRMVEVERGAQVEGQHEPAFRSNRDLRCGVGGEDTLPPDLLGSRAVNSDRSRPVALSSLRPPGNKPNRPFEE